MIYGCWFNPDILLQFLTILILLGLSSLIAGFAIITFITVNLFFKEQICFQELTCVFHGFELFLVFCGWLAIWFIILLVSSGIHG
jgi:hypothetical protein